MRIYLDHNATTSVAPSAALLMGELMVSCWGNPSSIHWEGQEARQLLSKSRRRIAAFLGVSPQEVIFTSGATEALNLVIRGLMGAHESGHIISSNLEHPAVLNTCKYYESRGYDLTLLSPGSYGAVTVDDVRQSLHPDTRLIAIMAVNNETGIKTDIAGIAALAEEKKIPFVVDGVALLGKELFSIPSGVTAMCFSAHKVYGPKGVGCAYVRKRTRLQPLSTGGGHELQRRPGTENLIGIAGFAQALEEIKKELPDLTFRLENLVRRLEERLRAHLPILINGEGPRVCNTINLAFPGVSGESLLMNLDLEGVSVSHGSACSSGALEPSRVLLNMGIDRQRAASSIRISLGRYNTVEDIDRAADIIIALVK